MYNNTFLIRLGINPDDYKKIDTSIIESNGQYIYDLEQKTDHDSLFCPRFGSEHLNIKGYFYTEYNISSTINIVDRLRIKKVRFKCMDCNKTFSPELTGINTSSYTTQFIKQQLLLEFKQNKTFAMIAKEFHLDKSTVLKYFDELYPTVSRKKLPRILCIDEFHFTSASGACKYCCVLSDHENKEIIDIIQSRKLYVLDDYFKKISQKERNNVEYFVSDMFDGYKTIKNKYFKNAKHIVDKFHVVLQLTNAVNNVRTFVMKRANNDYDDTYNFMKKHWKLFLCKKENIPDKLYRSKKTKKVYDLNTLLFNCIKSNDNLNAGYITLQDLYKISDLNSYDEIYNHIKYYADRLSKTTSESLNAVARTFMKWRTEIANAYSINKYGYNITNSVAENINNHIKTIIKNAYGYQNFDRFRKRCLLILFNK